MITPDIFRGLALDIPGAVEQSHRGHPDFRIGKRIFASLGYPNAGCAVLRLNLDQREILLAAEPGMFAPVPGGWGKKGATILSLAQADETIECSAMAMAAVISEIDRQRLIQVTPVLDNDNKFGAYGLDSALRRSITWIDIRQTDHTRETR